MTEVAADADEPGKGRLTQLGAGVSVVLGISVWMQVASFALRNDVAVTGLARALSVALPAIALFGGVASRSSIMLLAMFPLTLIPPLLLAPEGLGSTFADPWSAMRVAASLALYLSLVSSWVTASDGPIVRAEKSAPDSFARSVRRHVIPRVLPLFMWWAVPTYAVLYDPAIVGTIQQNHGDGAAAAQVFICVLLFFTWAIAAYMLFVVPALNLEYDRRRYVRDAQVMVAVEPRDVVRRLGITAVATVLVSLLLLSVV